MKTVPKIIDALGGNTRVSEGLGITTQGVSAMRRRNSIPVSHWPNLRAFAQTKGIIISNDDLVLAHTKRNR